MKSTRWTWAAFTSSSFGRSIRRTAPTAGRIHSSATACSSTNISSFREILASTPSSSRCIPGSPRPCCTTASFSPAACTRPSRSSKPSRQTSNRRCSWCITETTTRTRTSRTSLASSSRESSTTANVSSSESFSKAHPARWAFTLFVNVLIRQGRGRNPKVFAQDAQPIRANWFDF